MPGLRHARRTQIRLRDSLPQSCMPVLQSQLCARRCVASTVTASAAIAAASARPSIGMEFLSQFHACWFRSRSCWLSHHPISQFSRPEQDLLCRRALSPPRKEPHQGHRRAQGPANFSLTRSDSEFAGSGTADASARGSWAGMAEQKRAASAELPQKARNHLATV